MTMIYIGDDGKWHIGQPPNTGGDIEETFFHTKSVLMNIANITATIFITIASFVFIFGAIELALSSGNPMKRQRAYEKMKIALIGIALLGGFTTIINLAYSFFR